MSIFFGYETALAFWRNFTGDTLPSASKARPRCKTIPPTKQIEQIPDPLIEMLPKPYTLVVADAHSRGNARDVMYRIWNAAPNLQAFVCISPGVYVSTPEACFLQLAAKTELVELLKIGFELCGTYAIRTTDDAGFRNRTALTTKRRVINFIAHSAGTHGVKPARKAADLLIDKSASPAETNIALLLSLPTSLGGFGIPQPSLNHMITVPSAYSSFTKRSHFKGDFYWPKNRLILEYDSDLWHSLDNQIEEDAKRRNALEAMGIRVITLRKGQLYDAREFEKVAVQIQRHLGRYQKSRRKNVITLRYYLRQQVLNSRCSISPATANFDDIFPI